MSQDTKNILIDFIKFDMQQVEFYKNAIYRLIVFCISGTFAVSAFIFSRDSVLKPEAKSHILLGVNLGAIVIIALIGFYYIKNMDFIRKILEIRENSLKEHCNGKQLSSNDLYPDVNAYKAKFSLKSERIPLYIAATIIFLKLIVEQLLKF